LLMIIIPCRWFGITTNTSKIFMCFMLFMVNLYENRFTFWFRFIRVGEVAKTNTPILLVFLSVFCVAAMHEYYICTPCRALNTGKNST
jgi:hypothetical protein